MCAWKWTGAICLTLQLTFWVYNANWNQVSSLCHFFSSCKCILHPRLEVFCILGYKNVPEVSRPLANIYYKCVFIDQSIQSVNVQCYIQSQEACANNLPHRKFAQECLPLGWGLILLCISNQYLLLKIPSLSSPLYHKTVHSTEKDCLWNNVFQTSHSSKTVLKLIARRNAVEASKLGKWRWLWQAV